MKKNKMMSGIAPLIKRVRTLVLSARRTAVSAVNTLQVRTNFEVGRLIVEHEQRGHRRAGYGDVLIGTLAKQLTLEFGQGFSKRNLEYMRRFYTMYRSHFSQIAQKPSAQFTPLSWSHYVILMGIQDNRERRFYEIEAAQSGWSTPEFKRQLKSGLFERLALSRNKESIRRLAAKGQVVEKPQDILKSPLVLEFLGMEEKPVIRKVTSKRPLSTSSSTFCSNLGKAFYSKLVKNGLRLMKIIILSIWFSTTAFCAVTSSWI